MVSVPTPEGAVQALAWVAVELFSWERYFTVALPISTQMYKWAVTL